MSALSSSKRQIRTLRKDIIKKFKNFLFENFVWIKIIQKQRFISHRFISLVVVVYAFYLFQARRLNLENYGR